MWLDTFVNSARTDIQIPDAVLSELPCGLIGCPLPQAKEELPELSKLFSSVPVQNRHEWIIDLKIHMLMPGQFPCIPNWHCDFVPRDADRQAHYEQADDDRRLLLWVSGPPMTEFFDERVEVATPSDHGDLIEVADRVKHVSVKPQQWYQFSRLSPHRGVAATEYCWRIFARVAHRSLAVARPTDSVIRRHAQVYLDAARFTW